MRAALESIAYQTRELVEAMEADAGEPLRELRVDGGAAVNNFLMQFQADILGKPHRAARGHRDHGAGRGVSGGPGDRILEERVAEVESFWRAERRFEPKMPAGTRERFFGEWKAAVARARG